MTTNPFWHGIRMRRTLAGADPEAPERLITLPASWDEQAASALAALAGGAGPLRLAVAADRFIRPIAERCEAMGLGAALGERLRRLLLTRRGAPDAGLWQGRAGSTHGFVLNLAAFHDPELGFAIADFSEALDTAALALALARPEAPRVALRVADLAGLIASLGLDYDSEAARALGAAILALARGRTDATWARLAPPTGPARRIPVGLPLPAETVVPGLREAAVGALLEAASRGSPIGGAIMVIAPAGPAEALLGVETAGVAPAFGPLAPEGTLTRATRTWLAARGISPEAALARVLAGQSLFGSVTAGAATAMQGAVSPYAHEVSPMFAAASPEPGASTKRNLPAHARGYTQKVNVSGHRLYLRTGEHPDGKLGEIAITLHKEAPAVRGLTDAFAAAVSLGLQHGVPLQEFVELYLGTRFAPAGAVDGDPAVPRASSLVDYVFRNLAVCYLGRHDLPAAEIEDPVETATGAPGAAPLLPFDLPTQGASPSARRRALRLVSR